MVNMRNDIREHLAKFKKDHSKQGHATLHDKFTRLDKIIKETLEKPATEHDIIDMTDIADNADWSHFQNYKQLRNHVRSTGSAGNNKSYHCGDDWCYEIQQLGKHLAGHGISRCG
jgi:hypothetical protein